jgi:hypothetical protein
MKRAFIAALCLALFPLLARAAQPWQTVTVPSVAEAAAAFPAPPKEYRAIHWAIWGGQQTKERILADLAAIDANGAGVYMINNSRGVTPKYFTPEYLDLVKTVVDECKRRGLKLWIESDAGYPDGFAGGMIRSQYPQLGMQGIVADAKYNVEAGNTLKIPLPPDTLGILANAVGPRTPVEPQEKLQIPADKQFSWTAPGTGMWEIYFEGAEARYSVAAGQTLKVPVPPNTTGISVIPRTGGRGGFGPRGGGAAAAAPQPPQSVVIPVPSGDQFEWTAPAGSAYEVTFVRHVFRSSPTRYTNREDGTNDKDSLYTLIDYLNPEATQTYIKLIHEKYRELFGAEFGKTILGFRSDEPDYTGFIPWTPKLLETFQKQKGYDLKPYIVQFFANQLTPEAQRAKADYWDVWSAMFRDNFFKPLEDYAESHGMLYMTHLNHEELMLDLSRGEDLIRNEGSFFRDMRYSGVPGIDNLNQIRPGTVADFPKLMSSTSHLYGRPQCWTESGGGVGQAGKFVMDYQLVRGINYLNVRGMNSAASNDPNQLLNPGAAAAWYASRASYMLAIGRPAAQVALFHPTDSMWLGDQESDAVDVKLTTQLMEHQIDFDHIDFETLASICTLENGGIKNLSGQVYRAVVIPSCTVINQKMLDRLKAFAAGGGKVVFVGRTPTMVWDQNYLHASTTPPDLSFATIEPTPEITAKVIAALPKPDVKLDSDAPAIKYMHRSLKDGEVYFFFNESNQNLARTVTLAGSGQPQVWDASRGVVNPIAGAAAAQGSATIPLNLAPYESRFIVIGPLPAGAGTPMTSVTGARTLASLDGDWSIALGDRQSSGALKPIQDLGGEGFTGLAQYRKTFNAASLPQGQRVFVDLGIVRDIARMKINGKELDARGWAPYVWDITDSVKPGDNTLEVAVQIGSIGGGDRGFGGGGGGGRAGAGRAGASAAAGRGGRAGRGAAAAGEANTNPAQAGAARGGGRGRGAAEPDAAASPLGLLGPVRVIAQ